MFLNKLNFAFCRLYELYEIYILFKLRLLLLYCRGGGAANGNTVWCRQHRTTTTRGSVGRWIDPLWRSLRFRCVCHQAIDSVVLFFFLFFPLYSLLYFSICRREMNHASPFHMIDIFINFRFNQRRRRRKNLILILYFTSLLFFYYRIV